MFRQIRMFEKPNKQWYHLKHTSPLYEITLDDVQIINKEGFTRRELVFKRFDKTQTTIRCRNMFDIVYYV